ncbi:MAG: hypothetical protein PHD05_00995 [Sphaerochaetaceae bacterium]|nr:hypothetical protein [Sphaerochaetaceae bacterium]
MIKGINLPELDYKEKSSTRDLIIEVLSKEWPLTTKEIYFRVKNIGKTQLSYQAIHKTLTQMIKNGLVAKNHKKFQLSMDWITKVEKFSSLLRSAYNDKQKIDLKELYKDNQVNLTFDNPLELGGFLCNTYFHYPNPRNKCTIILATNTYPLIGLSVKDIITLAQSSHRFNLFMSLPH